MQKKYKDANVSISEIQDASKNDATKRLPSPKKAVPEQPPIEVLRESHLKTILADATTNPTIVDVLIYSISKS